MTTNGTYWQSRKNLAYYREARDYVRLYAPNAETMLDVGAGVGVGCRYLEWFADLQRTAVELPTSGCQLPSVHLVHADFAEWEPDKRYDVVLCLQVLEHIEDVKAFAQKLLECGDVVVVSVPYRWEQGKCSAHVHDPVDEHKLKGWLGREPMESVIVDSRLVAVYQGNDKEGKTGRDVIECAQRGPMATTRTLLDVGPQLHGASASPSAGVAYTGAERSVPSCLTELEPTRHRRSSHRRAESPERAAVRVVRGPVSALVAPWLAPTRL